MRICFFLSFFFFFFFFFFVLCTPFDNDLYLNRNLFCKHVFNCFQVQIKHDCFTKNTKGHNSNNIEDGANVCFFCASAESGMILYIRTKL